MLSWPVPDELRRAAPGAELGPGRGPAGRLPGRPAAGRHLRRHHLDRGLFGVYLVGERATRVGELDEEMVYESRSARCSPSAPPAGGSRTSPTTGCYPGLGQPGKLPFWHGDMLGRPVELGPGAFLRELGGLTAETRLSGCGGRVDFAAGNLTAYLDEQREATGSCPTTAPSWSSASATSFGRLAGLRPLPLRRPGACSPGPRPSRPGSGSGWAWRSRPCTPTTG